MTGGGPRIPFDPEKAIEEDMRWVDRLEPLDEDATEAALERPGPDRRGLPRFTREMAERGRHMIGETVIREARGKE